MTSFTSHSECLTQSFISVFFDLLFSLSDFVVGLSGASGHVLHTGVSQGASARPSIHVPSGYCSDLSPGGDGDGKVVFFVLTDGMRSLSGSGRVWYHRAGEKSQASEAS